MKDHASPDAFKKYQWEDVSETQIPTRQCMIVSMTREEKDRPQKKSLSAIALEEAGDHTLRRNVDGLGRRRFRQAGHGHDVAAHGDDEARAGADAHLAHLHRVPARRAAVGRVRREGHLRLRDADLRNAMEVRPTHHVECLTTRKDA